MVSWLMVNYVVCYLDVYLVFVGEMVNYYDGWLVYLIR